jgi:hypothetical protein
MGRTKFLKWSAYYLVYLQLIEKHIFFAFSWKTHWSFVLEAQNKHILFFDAK